MTAADPTVDNTDTYAFRSPDAPETTTLIANWLPFQEPGGGPNFYPWAEGDEARYNIKIDNDGDAVEDITYEWAFTNVDVRENVPYPAGAPDADPSLPANGSFLYNNGKVNSFNDATLLFKQTYDLTAIVEGVPTVLLNDAPVAPSRVGDASMPNYQALRDEAIRPIAGGKAFAGQADDSFFLDLRIFDLLYGTNLKQVGNDTLAPYNVNSVALQVPTASLLGAATYDHDTNATTPPIIDPTIGVWSTTDRASVRTLNGVGGLAATGEYVQVSRLGNPLVNEVVIPAHLKDTFNSLDPASDAGTQAAVNKVVNPELPYLLNTIYQLPVPETPRNDLFTIFLTGITGLNRPLSGAAVRSEVLRLNTSVAVTAEPNRLGVLAGDFQGYPNGRRLTDDVLDIAVQAVAGAVTVGDNDNNPQTDTVGGTTGVPSGVKIIDALAAGDGVNTNDVAFATTFPYLALPKSGSAVRAVQAVPGPTVTVTAAAAPAPTVTMTAAAGTRATGPAPRGGIPTGQAGTSGPSTGGLALMGLAVLALGAGGYVAVTRRGRQAGSA